MPMSLPSRPLNKEKALEIIKDFIKEILPSEVWYKNITHHIKAIILYGSVAKGINRPDSDIDILIVLPLEIEEKYTKGEYCYKYQNQEINIVMRSEERLKILASKYDNFQAEVFKECEFIWRKDDKIEKIINEIKLKKRAVGIITKDDKILLFRRIKDNEEYFVFPGGGVEEGETIEDAVIRELKEELCINVTLDKFLFDIYVEPNPHENGRTSYFYLVTEFSGKPKLGGPEKDRMNKNNQYYPEWHKISDLKGMTNLFPSEAKIKLIELLIY